ncbi:hypothetical protein BGZ82_002575, partial [Podila clonocystis]
MRSLESLTNDAMAQVRHVVKTQSWYLVYDNINFPLRKSDQRSNNVDTFESGTTATVVIGDDLGTVDQLRPPFGLLRMEDLVPDDANVLHFKCFCRYHLVEILRRHNKSYQYCSVPIPKKDPLPIKKTMRFPLPSMPINQASVEGNMHVLNDITVGMLQLPPGWFNGGKRIVIAGDQLTVARVRTLKRYWWDDTDDYNKLMWATPVMQLFHLQMLLGHTILRTHFGEATAGGSLAFNVTMLGWKRVKVDKLDFHAVDELLRHTFEAMVLRVWEIVLETDDLDTLAWELGAAGISHMTALNVDTILDRYLNISDSERFGSMASRNAALFIRDMLLYVELSSAIKMGDIGRIEEVLRWLTVMFQAGTTKNYAYELLHLHCGLHYSWPSQMKRAVMSSWLVNTTGKPNRWFPSDLYQEHNNLSIKVIHAAKGSSTPWEMLAKSVSTNIETFNEVAAQLESQYKIPKNRSKHKVVSADEDINKILRSLKEHGILEYECGPKAATDPVSDLFEDGLVNL